MANSSRIKFIAHRMNIGDDDDFTNNYMDNSFEALESLCKEDPLSKIAGFECDLRLTKDKKPVIVHNKKVNGIDIDSLTLNQWDKLKIKDKFLSKYDLTKPLSFLLGEVMLSKDLKIIRKIYKEKYYKECFILSANKMFDYLVNMNYQGEIILEIKESDKDTKKIAINLLNKYKAKLNIIVHSYHEAVLLKIKEETDLKIGLLADAFKLTQKIDINSKYIEKMPFDFYSIDWKKLNTRIILDLTENNKNLYIWNILNEAELNIVLNLLNKVYKRKGILPENIGLISDIPLILSKYVDKNVTTKLFHKKIANKFEQLNKKGLL